MKKTKSFLQTRFSADVIEQAAAALRAQAPFAESRNPRLYLSVDIDGASWHHDSEAEFMADYRRSERGAVYQLELGAYGFRFQAAGTTTIVDVTAPQRREIESVFSVLEQAAPQFFVPGEASEADREDSEEVCVFIGHGHSNSWRDLKDHLHEKHGYRVVAYEIGARAGHTVRDVLESMLDESAIAFLVMTGEDLTADGALNPRLNVVHEAGLFQGRLGFERAIVLLEQGTNEFSNIHGIE